MSNIDKQAQKELYAKVEKQAHKLRGNPIAYQVVTGMCPVNVIEMQAQKIQVLLDELEAAEKRGADQSGIIASARKFISEYAGFGDVGAAEFIKIIDRAAAAGKGE